MSKKSFLLMRDLLSTVELMTDEEAGQLFKSIINHVDGEPVELSREINFAFIPIRNQLDRDVDKYAIKCENLRKNASSGGLASASKRKQMVANGSKSKQIERDTVNDNVTVTDTVIKDKKRFKPPTQQELMNYCSEKRLNIDAETFIDFYQSKNWFVGKSKMKDWQATARNWARRNKVTNDKSNRTESKSTRFVESLCNIENDC